MQARSALFDVFGDHLRARGGRAPVAALVRLMGALDIAAPAVRTAVSRMVRQGWLAPERLPSGPGYALTSMAERRLDEAYARIYRTRPTEWDGRWHVVVVGPPSGRAARERLGTGLTYLGYAPLRTGTWVAPRASSELAELLATEGVEAECFHAAYDGSPVTLASRAWDLDRIAGAYAGFEARAAALTRQGAAAADGDAAAFVTRSELVHEWRKLLFVDPGLPAQVLPPDWAGTRAARMFDTEAERLLPAARRYVDRCLEDLPDPLPDVRQRMTADLDGAPQP